MREDYFLRKVGDHTFNFTREQDLVSIYQQENGLIESKLDYFATSYPDTCRRVLEKSRNDN